MELVNRSRVARNAFGDKPIRKLFVDVKSSQHVFEIGLPYARLTGAAVLVHNMRAEIGVDCFKERETLSSAGFYSLFIYMFYLFANGHEHVLIRARVAEKYHVERARYGVVYTARI